MRKAFAYILNRPFFVIAVSLVIALSAGYIVTSRINASVPLAFVKAASGTIRMEEGNAAQNHMTLAFLISGRIADVQAHVGDAVKKDQVLASLDAGNTAGSITQAQAALDTAQANYQKVLNGATGPTIDAAKATLHTATVALDQIKKQQEVNVHNAYDALLNATPEASLADYDQSQAEDEVPTISGSYVLGKEGQIVIKTYASIASSGLSITLSGLATGTESVTSVAPQPLGDTGLFIKFPPRAHANRTWTVSLPNTKATDYIGKYNAYQSALQTQTQAVETAKAAVDQAQSNVVVVTAAARPEDVQAAQAQVENAQGALQIAQAAYGNTLLKAPSDGTITAVRISQGQIAAANTPAVELAATTTDINADVVVPNAAVISRTGKTYVLLETSAGVQEREVTIGAHDDHNTQITGGLREGDEIAIQQ